MTRQITCRLTFLTSRLAFILSLLLCLSISQIAFSATAEEHNAVDSVSAVHPGTDLWREVRQRDIKLRGNTQIKSVDSDVLINPYGDQWARFRVDEIVTFGAIALAVVVLIILVFFLIRGCIKLREGFSGNRVRRFSQFQIIAHWMMASFFLFLGVTGLILLFGRTALIPLIGHEAFSLLAAASKLGHNLTGLVFLLSLLLLLFGLVKRNLYEKGDLKWVLSAGGLLGKSHPSIGFFNLGEKCLFWIVILLGLVISVSGLIMVTPNFGQGRIVMELSHIAHAVGALLLIAVSFGHMYLSLFGVEGALEGMKSGFVDINWAEAHHDRWARECREKNKIIRAEIDATGS